MASRRATEVFQGLVVVWLSWQSTGSFKPGAMVTFHVSLFLPKFLYFQHEARFFNKHKIIPVWIKQRENDLVHE